MTRHQIEEKCNLYMQLYNYTCSLIELNSLIYVTAYTQEISYHFLLKLYI